MTQPPPISTLFPYTTLFRSHPARVVVAVHEVDVRQRRRRTASPENVPDPGVGRAAAGDRKSTRLNSSHRCISYAVFCLKKKKTRERLAQRCAHNTSNPCRST